jgi:zinc/manganese transport system substrate-binding protein
VGLGRIAVGLTVVVVAAAAHAACGGSGAGAGSAPSPGSASAESAKAERPTIVVTYSVLGSVVRKLVGDRAAVQVIIPNGVDPHDYQASAKDVEAITNAHLLIENGLDLEEGLEDAIDGAKDAGVETFTATEHIEVRTVGEGEAAEADDPDQQPGAKDPHLWMDPSNMKGIVAALVPVVEQELGIDVAGRGSELERRLEDLNAKNEEILSVIPAPRRKLVTGHESMGYFARRYGFELVGAIIPSLSSQAEVSASELADLKTRIEEQHVPAIFTELGTPPEVAKAIGDESGVAVVEIATHSLAADGSYFTFMEGISREVADALR